MGKDIRTWDGRSPKLGPNSCIHSSGLNPGYIDPDLEKILDNYTPIKVGMVVNKSVVYPTAGSVYLVYRKPEDDNKKPFPWEGKYCICIFKNNSWVPIATPWIENGAPLEDDDEYMDLESVFNPKVPEPTLCDTVPVNDVRTYIEKRRKTAEEEGLRKEPQDQTQDARELSRLKEDFGYALDYIDILENKIETGMEIIEKKIDDAQIWPFKPVNPYTPLEPLQPVSPGYPTSPSVPQWPAWPPYGPIISYSLPGGVNVTTTGLFRPVSSEKQE